MARKQVLVQLDDELLKDLDEAAKAAGVSRSALIRRASEHFLEAAHELELDRQMQEGYRRVPPDEDWNDYYAQLAREGAGGDAETR
jgi:metal-responsive CopG/Arc/MetJ family transcriptional regulator